MHSTKNDECDHNMTSGSIHTTSSIYFFLDGVFFFIDFFDEELFFKDLCLFVIVDIFGLSRMDGFFSNGFVDVSLSELPSGSGSPFRALLAPRFAFSSISSTNSPEDDTSPKRLFPLLSRLHLKRKRKGFNLNKFPVNHSSYLVEIEADRIH